MEISKLLINNFKRKMQKKKLITYSRATTAPCDIKPPSSVTTPDNNGKYGLHPISVLRVIKISPFCISLASSKFKATRAVARTTPLNTGVPVN